MLIVQRIRTEWTKKSRGGEAAAVRNAVPASLLLSSSLADGGASGLIHDVRYSESFDFQPRETVRRFDSDTAWLLDSLWLSRQVDHVLVRFVWSRHATGAPKRKSKDVFVLRPGEWGRLKCNGRFSDVDFGMWSYRQDTFNVAWMQDLDPNRFVSTIPDFEVLELARLR